MASCPECGGRLAAQLTVLPTGDTRLQECCPACGAAVAPEDHLAPLYCRRCHGPTLRAHIRGALCPRCAVQEAQQAMVRQAEAEAAARAHQAQVQAQAVAQQQALFGANTGRGFCAQCGSRNVQEFRTGASGGGAQATAACVGCFVFWPALFLIPFLGGGSPTIHRRCAYCGHQWVA